MFLKLIYKQRTKFELTFFNKEFFSALIYFRSCLGLNVREQLGLNLQGLENMTDEDDSVFDDLGKP